MIFSRAFWGCGDDLLLRTWFSKGNSMLQFQGLMIGVLLFG